MLTENHMEGTTAVCLFAPEFGMGEEYTEWKYENIMVGLFSYFYNKKNLTFFKGIGRLTLELSLVQSFYK